MTPDSKTLAELVARLRLRYHHVQGHPWEDLADAAVASADAIEHLSAELVMANANGKAWRDTATANEARATAASALEDLQGENALLRKRVEEWRGKWTQIRLDTVEADKRAEAAEAEVARLREVLGSLYDEQNGAPLIRREAEWGAAMEAARAALEDRP